MAIFVRDSFQLLPQLVPDTRTLSLLKLTHNTKRSLSSNKQSESVNIRPKLVEWWLSWVFATQERKKERKLFSGTRPRSWVHMTLSLRLYQCKSFVPGPARLIFFFFKFFGCFAESFAGWNFAGWIFAEFDPKNIPAKPPANIPQRWRLWKKVKEKDCCTEGRFSHRTMGGQRSLEKHVWGVWLLTARWPNLRAEFLTFVHLWGAVLSDLGEGDPASIIFYGVTVRVKLRKVWLRKNTVGFREVETTVFDPASVFLSTHWWSQKPSLPVLFL